MSIKQEAAFHEAGHAVAAFRSRFHNIVGTISLEQYGAGEIFVSLSKRKLRAAGLPVDESSEAIKEVAVDLAVVLCAGLVAERLAAERIVTLRANPACAEPDHTLLRNQLSKAGLSRHFDRHEETARNLLSLEWPLLNSLASYLYSKVTVEPTDVIAFLEQASNAALTQVAPHETPPGEG